MQHKVWSSKIFPEHQEHIIKYYEQLWDRGIVVSSQSLVIDELLCVAPQMNNVGVSVLQCHVLHVLKNIYVTPCSITHKAQNTPYQ